MALKCWYWPSAVGLLQLVLRTDIFGILRQLNRFLCGVGSAACHDGHAPASLLYRYADDFTMFRYIYSRRFACSAHNANAIGLFSNMPIDQLAQRGVIDRAIGGKRRC